MRYLSLLLCFLLSTALHALTLKESAPRRYVVQYGDTLWSIANCYLEYPWEWKSLWRANPQIKNPDRLYPGDVILLKYAHSSPYVKVLPNGTVKLSPHVRPILKDGAIPPIPLGDIKPFLDESLVMDRNRLETAPYVVAFSGERLLGGQGDEVYVKNLHPSARMPRGMTYSYAIFRQCGEYLDPITQEFLGLKAEMVGYGELSKGGEPAKMLLTTIIKGVKLEDRVLPNNQPEFSLYFEPQAPRGRIDGMIIDFPGGYNQAAVGYVMVINRGKNAGLRPGDVLGIYGKCRTVPDPKDSMNPVVIPPERIGEAMVFRTFSKTSFALVVRSIRTVYIKNTVANP